MAYNGSMRFEWDEQKNRANFKKHKVWFEEAQTLWSNAHCLEFYDPEHSEEQDRVIRIGHSSNNRILLVVFCEKGRDQTIRIISARKATPKEARASEEGI
jgi:uncharacterized protein